MNSFKLGSQCCSYKWDEFVVCFARFGVYAIIRLGKLKLYPTQIIQLRSWCYFNVLCHTCLPHLLVTLACHVFKVNTNVLIITILGSWHPTLAHTMAPPSVYELPTGELLTLCFNVLSKFSYCQVLLNTDLNFVSRTFVPNMHKQTDMPVLHFNWQNKLHPFLRINLFILLLARYALIIYFIFYWLSSSSFNNLLAFGSRAFSMQWGYCIYSIKTLAFPH